MADTLAGALIEAQADSVMGMSMINEELTINDETRVIYVPESERLFGVESDKKAERKWFHCPRYVGDNIDLSEMVLSVNYRNANNETDMYIVDDVEVVEEGSSETEAQEYITFSWLLSRKATSYRGVIQFIVCATKTDEEGNITKEWNTTIAQGEVLTGLEAEIRVDNESVDVLRQLINLSANSSSEAKKASETANNALVEARRLKEQLQELINQAQEIVDSLDTVISETPIEFFELDVLENIESGETIPEVFGKVQAVFNNLGEAAECDVLESLDNTTREIVKGKVLSASIGEQIKQNTKNIEGITLESLGGVSSTAYEEDNEALDALLDKLEQRLNERNKDVRNGVRTVITEDINIDDYLSGEHIGSYGHYGGIITGLHSGVSSVGVWDTMYSIGDGNQNYIRQIYHPYNSNAFACRRYVVGSITPWDIFYPNGVKILRGFNLDSILDQGHYFCLSDNLNLPANDQGVLDVYSTIEGGVTIVYHRFECFSLGEVYTRIYINSTGWSNWRLVSGTGLVLEEWSTSNDSALVIPSQGYLELFRMDGKLAYFACITSFDHMQNGIYNVAISHNYNLGSVVYLVGNPGTVTTNNLRVAYLREA